MSAESLSDTKIEDLLKSQKKVVGAGPKAFKQQNQHLKADYELEGQDGWRFVVFARQNTLIDEDFSCGIRVRLRTGEDVILVRYNGSSHSHTNMVEGDTIENKCHIHRATERYLAAGGKAEHFAVETDVYSTLDGAMGRLCKDCHIEGLSLPPLPLKARANLFGESSR